MASSFGSVKERTFELIETGEYVFLLDDLEFTTGGTYGDSLKWVWYVAPKEEPTQYIARDDGQARTLHVYTNPDIIIGSQQHEWVQVLTGRQFDDGDEPPDDSELVGKRMVAYLTHYAPKQGPNAGKQKEKIVAGSAKPFRLPGQKANGTSKPAPTQVSADPAPEDVDRALIVSKLQKQVAKLTKLNKEAGEAAQQAMDDSDLTTAPLDAIQGLLDDVTAAVVAALDA
jgi:hypothetical protein